MSHMLIITFTDYQLPVSRLSRSSRYCFHVDNFRIAEVLTWDRLDIGFPKVSTAKVIFTLYDLFFFIGNIWRTDRAQRGYNEFPLVSEFQYQYKIIIGFNSAILHEPNKITVFDDKNTFTVQIFNYESNLLGYFN